MIPYFRFHRAPWGTVYLLQSAQKPDLYKVGFTKRRTIDRRAELNRHSGHDMKVVATVSLPWARTCEALLLTRLRRNPLRKRHPFGTEWFVLSYRESIEDIVSRLDAAADRIRLIARLKLSWPKGSEIKKFRVGSWQDAGVTT